MLSTRLFLSIFVMGAVSGCASTPQPTEKLTSSEAAIRGATEVGAPQVPQAALHLQYAQEQVAQARVLMKNGDNERAGLLLMRAQADAELALALARENATKAEAQKAMDEAKALRHQAM